MNKTAPLKNVVFFLCSPSLGILDNWLPVIWNLKEKQKDLKFIIIFPRASFIDQIYLSNVLLILGANIFDSIVFKSKAGLWLAADTFSQVKMINKLTMFEWFLLRVIRKLKKWAKFCLTPAGHFFLLFCTKNAFSAKFGVFFTLF